MQANGKSKEHFCKQGHGRHSLQGCHNALVVPQLHTHEDDIPDFALCVLLIRWKGVLECGTLDFFSFSHSTVCIPCCQTAEDGDFIPELWLVLLGLVNRLLSAPHCVCLGHRGSLAEDGVVSPPFTSPTPNLF